MPQRFAGKAEAVLVKARAVVRQLGRADDGDLYREYRDWHLEVRAGTYFVSIWSSAAMVFLSMANRPVYYQPGPWEQYLERLFQKTQP